MLVPMAFRIARGGGVNSVRANKNSLSLANCLINPHILTKGKSKEMRQGFLLGSQSPKIVMSKTYAQIHLSIIFLLFGKVLEVKKPLTQIKYKE